MNPNPWLLLLGFAFGALVWGVCRLIGYLFQVTRVGGLLPD